MHQKRADARAVQAICDENATLKLRVEELEVWHECNSRVQVFSDLRTAQREQQSFREEHRPADEPCENTTPHVADAAVQVTTADTNPQTPKCAMNIERPCLALG